MFLQQYPTEQGCTWKKIRQRLVWNNGTKVLMHRKHEKFRRHQTDSSPRYIQTRSRECTSREVWAGSMVRGLDTQAALRLAVTTKPVTRTHKVTGCAQNWRTVKKEESISPGSRHVWMQSDRRKRLPQASNVGGVGSPPAASGASSSSASGYPAMDIDSQPSRKRAADLQTEDLEDGEQTALTEVDANESTLSLPQAESLLLMDERSVAVGNTVCPECTTSVGKTRLPETNVWASAK